MKKLRAIMFIFRAKGFMVFRFKKLGETDTKVHIELEAYYGGWSKEIASKAYEAVNNICQQHLKYVETTRERSSTNATQGEVPPETYATN